MKLFLKRRKNRGFTLVEVIVVVAIIGVLAAILIPTLIGYVTRSKVVSMNGTAADLRKHIDNFFTNADAKGYGMKIGSDIVCTPTVTVTGGEWKMVIPESPLDDIFVSKTLKWGGSGIGHYDDSKVGKFADEVLMIDLAQTYPEVRNAFISFRMEGGKCMALYITTETNTPITMQTFGPGG